MKALTLWQPWASLMALGVKWIETRSWSTSYRGWLAIHAAARRPEIGLVLGDRVVGTLNGEPVLHGVATPLVTKALPLGSIVAAGRLVDVLPITDRWPDVHLLARLQRDAPRERSRSMFLRRHELLGGEADGLCFVSSDGGRGYTDGWANDQIPFGDFTPGRFAWIFEDLVRVEQRCPWCRDRAPDAAPGVCVSIDGDWWHEPGSCRYCASACPVCRAGTRRVEPIAARGRQQLWEWTPETQAA